MIFPRDLFDTGFQRGCVGGMEMGQTQQHAAGQTRPKARLVAAGQIARKLHPRMLDAHRISAEGGEFLGQQGFEPAGHCREKYLIQDDLFPGDDSGGSIRTHWAECNQRAAQNRESRFSGVRETRQMPAWKNAFGAVPTPDDTPRHADFYVSW